MQGAAEACRQQGHAFVPLAMETLGGLHKVMVAQVKMLAAALARHTGQEEWGGSKTSLPEAFSRSHARECHQAGLPGS